MTLARTLSWLALATGPAVSLTAADRAVYFCAVPPTEPAITAAQQSTLAVGQATLTVDDATASVLDLAGGWMTGRLAAVWKKDAAGITIDAQGLETADPAKFQLDHYLVSALVVSFRGTDGLLTTQTVLGPTAPLTAPIPFTVAPAAKAGEIYWYDASGTEVVDVKNGTTFVTPGAAQAFARQDLYLPGFELYRAQTNRWNTSAAYPDFGIVHTPTRTLATGSYPGGIFAIVTSDYHGYVFHGAACTVDGVPNPDPYLFQGVAEVVPGAVTQPDGSIGWILTTFATERHVYTCQPAATAPPGEVVEPYATQWNAMLTGASAAPTITSTPVNRGTVDGQDVAELQADAQLVRTGTPDDQAQITQTKTALTGTEYLSVDANGNVTTQESPTYADAGLESLRSGIATGFVNQVAIDLQNQPNLAQQLAPVVQDPPAADTLALSQAIGTVEASIYDQTATNLPLRPLLGNRYAEMNPAGWLPSYLTGNPIPGDGTNPEEAHPSGVVTGAPCYDLNGDGSLDRFGSDDPYRNGFDQILVKWDVDARLIPLGDYPADFDKCTFAVYGQAHDHPEQRKLLFCGFDGTMWRERKLTRKGGKFGVTQYSFALKSLLESTGPANTYHLALAFAGPSVPAFAPTTAPSPTTTTVSWTDTSSIANPDGTTTTTTVSGTETVYLYADVADESDLLTESFSDPAFVPRATTGRPVMAAKYVRTLTPLSPAPGAPITATVYFPHDFTEDQIAVDQEPPIPSYPNTFRWGFSLLGDGFPWNYNHGDHFPTGSSACVVLNDPSTIAHFGGEFPLQPTDSIVEGGGVDITMQEAPDLPAGLTPVAGITDPNDPGTIANATIWANWTNLRAMWHTPWDPRTDMNAGGDPTANHHHGERTYNLLEGAGYYLFKGRWVSVASGDAQKALLRQMWEWDMYQPRTTYVQLHLDNDPAKPLLNTVRAPLAGTSAEIDNPTSGILSTDLHQTGGPNTNQNAARRAQLIDHFVFIFSAAHGREHEIDMALHTPKNTHLICVEWDDWATVQKLFATYDIEYTTTDELERKAIGGIITTFYGKTNIQARTAGDGTPTTAVTGDASVITLETQSPGQYVFTSTDLLYDKPANFLPTVALLGDGQYGAPTADQWVSSHKMQFRHPMALIYDDRWSALVAAYGLNADPRQWCAHWGDYALPVIGDGSDTCKLAFETWITAARLSNLYDRMHADQFDAVRPGNITLPPRPAVVAQPVAPVSPPAWTDGPVTFPVVVADPGPQPTPPINAVWSDTKPDWLANSATGGRGGPSLGDISLIPDWALTFPMTQDLQSAHDTWIAQFPNTSTITSVSPQTFSGGTTVHFNPTFTPSGSQNITAFTMNVAPHTVYTLSTPLFRTSLAIGHPVVVSGTDPSGNTLGITATRSSATGYTYTALVGGIPNFGVDPAGGWAYVLGNQSVPMGVPTTGTYPEITFPAGKYFWNIFAATHTATIHFTLSSATMVNVIAFSFDDTQVFCDGVRLDDFGGDHFGAPIDRTYPQVLAAGPHTVLVTTDGNGSGFGARGVMVRINSIASNAKAIADADLAIWQHYQADVQTWNNNNTLYQTYLGAEAAADAKLALYNEWLAEQPAKLAQYAKDLADYTIAQAAYESYLTADAAWQATYEANRAAIEAWNAYASARDAWLYLVTTRAAEPGVDWGTSEPIGDAFTFWKTTPDCTCE